jgi:hypothetical protein
MSLNRKLELCFVKELPPSLDGFLNRSPHISSMRVHAEALARMKANINRVGTFADICLRRAEDARRYARRARRVRSDATVIVSSF